MEKPKASVLFKELFVHSQKAFESEWGNFINIFFESAEGVPPVVISFILSVIENYGVYLRTSMTKTFLSTLATHGFIEMDIDINNSSVTNNIIKDIYIK